jgi:small subunit ribosomal protein S2
MSQSTMVQLLEAGAHYGHRTNSWNPKMAPYIYGTRNKIHIIDLGQTAPMLENALQALKQVAAQGGRILFVGTKPQASEAIAEAAQRCGQYFVNHRWLGGMMTNWNTVSASIKTLENREKMLADEESGFTKKKFLIYLVSATS